MLALLDKLYLAEALTQEESNQLFHDIVNGDMDVITMTAAIIGLKIKGETPQEIAGAAQAVRRACQSFAKPSKPVADSCGTGGDGLKTINISTAASFVAAACGIPMAKHGNRSVSSQCGSADVLEMLGVKVEHDAEVAEKCLQELDVCFLYAPFYHQGVRHAAPIRKTLATRTIFNVLGPLSNPAKPEVQLMGVYDPTLCRPIAETLAHLGCQRAMVVHGEGLDEIALHGVTQVAEMNQGKITEYTIEPSDFGIERAELSAIVGGDAQENAQAIRAVLAGEGDLAHRHIIAMNTAALVYLYGIKNTLKEAMDFTLDILHQGKALKKLEQLVEMTNG
ncbi:MAG: anthranilate phosphoribosyltransferase [Pseudomonadota bacterium]